MPLETFRSLGWTEESLRRSRPGRPAPTRARARAGRPGVGPIVQVCTSTTFPVYALRLHGLCCDFLNADPPHALGKHARGHYKVDFVYSNSAFRARCMAHSVTVGAMCAMLRLAGEGRVAQKARPWSHRALLLRARCMSLLLQSAVIALRAPHAHSRR